VRRLAAVLAVALLATAACGIDPKPRTLPAGFANPRFMLVSDEAQGPLLIGGDYGMRYSLDGGRTWLQPTAWAKPALAAASYRTSILVSRGTTSQVYGYALQDEAEPRMPWPFAGAVTLLAGNARRWRLWALTKDGALRYSNDGGVNWWSMPAVGLCERPRAIALSAPNRDGVERLWAACGRAGLIASDDLAVGLDQVRDLDQRPRRLGDARVDRDRVAEPDGAPVAGRDVDDGEVEPARVHLGVVVAAVREQRDPGLLEPRDVRGVVDDAHRVRLGEAHADRVRERVARRVRRRLDQGARHVRPARPSGGSGPTCPSGAARCGPSGRR
jgi:hypothetical protein